ncbi:MAG: hypothetical protein DRJ50_09005, partial [Actinobacteria bacterium]
PVTFAEVDHLDGWQDDDGPTDIDNSSIGCKHHNRAKHRNRYRAERRFDGQIIFHRPDGTPMLPIGQRPPPETDEQTQNRHLRRRIESLYELGREHDKRLNTRDSDL